MEDESHIFSLERPVTPYSFCRDILRMLYFILDTISLFVSLLLKKGDHETSPFISLTYL